MAYSRHCSDCKVDWPNMWPDFQRCPHCDAETTQRNGDELVPLKLDQVDSKLRHLEFDDFCEERDKAELERMEHEVAAELAALPVAAGRTGKVHP